MWFMENLFADIPTTIHDAHNRNSAVLLARNIENKVVVYWHDAHIALVPVLFFHTPNSLRIFANACAIGIVRPAWASS